MKTILAIDPGASGGFAYFCEGGVSSLAAPDTEGDVLDYIKQAAVSAHLDNHTPIAYVEEVGGYIGRPQPGSAMFKFGRNFGFILGCLQSHGYRIELVKPQKWQKHFGFGSKGASSTTEWKNKLKSRAQQLFPSVKVTLKTADALLILDYARRMEAQ